MATEVERDGPWTHSWIARPRHLHGAVGLSPVTTYSDVAPPDRADTNPLDEALRAILRALASTNQPKPTVTVRLDRDAWDKARTYYQRPYRGRPSEFGVYLDCGTVWVEPAEEQGPTMLVVPEGTFPPIESILPGTIIPFVDAKPEFLEIVPPRTTAPIDRDVVDARSAEVASVTLGSTTASTGVTADYGGEWRESK